VAGLAFALAIVVLLLMQLPILAWARGRSRLRVAALAGAVFATSWLVLASGVGNPWLIVAALGIFALGEALLSPTLPALVNDLAPEELRGRYHAVVALSQQLGPVVAPVLGGFALGHGLGVPYLVLLAAMCLAAGGVALTLRRGVTTTVDTGTPDGGPLTPGRPPTRRAEAVGRPSRRGGTRSTGPRCSS
jgi:MFS family permease